MLAQRNRSTSPIKQKCHLRGEKPLLAGLIGHALPLSVKNHFDFGCRACFIKYSYQIYLLTQ
jgi:hypothetical protein